MSVRTLALDSRSNAAASTYETVYTVPSGATAIVKEIRAFNTNATAKDLLIAVHTATTEIIILKATLATNAAVQHTCWTVIEPGDYIRFWTTAPAGDMRLLISGSQLLGVV